ncbi:dihydropteroate synthase [Fodinibius roseus]|uniref:Dihydropteroate synthase n=1 Tax=Fodinibius roseus TaxID=1194090 RepID=A0A1M5ID65_9BACT|nr:dihydropteroate synthase [Fodinibius roseus]SHG26019.1 dihydropteroate synthase [Fodinibius roseus]
MDRSDVPARHKLPLRDELLDLSSPRIMGVLNVTPDSFSDGGTFNEADVALDRIAEMISEGADIIDIGGESTRPGADPVSERDELDRVIPVMEQAIPAHAGTFFSIDTTKPRVAEEALKRGAHLVNDVSGLKELRLVDLCVEYNAGYILMHTQGDPQTMQQNPEYDEVVNDLFLFFKEKIATANERGLQNIIIDPGIGFGKTLRHNIDILSGLESFRAFEHPLMIGASRKSMIGEILDGRPVDDRLTGTVVTHYHALMNGADLIRVHDVKEAYDSVLVYKALTSG